MPASYAMKPIRVAVLIDTIACDTAGTQKQLLETIRRLDPRRVEISLICLWASPWMATHELPCRVEVLDYKGFLKPSFPGVVRRLAGVLERERVDVVHTFFEDSIFVAWFASLLAYRPPVFVSSRRDMGLGVSNQPWYHRLFQIALPFVNRRFAAIVANSEQVRRYVARREKTSASRISVVYNGVAMPVGDETAAPSVMAQYADDFWLVIVASLTPVKRHDVLLRAFAALASADPDRRQRLAILGDGEMRAQLEDLAKQERVFERVHFFGVVSDVGRYLQHADVGVLCSDREGLSNAVLEYMSHGLPVVATDVGGNAELIGNECGILVPAQQPAALADAIRRLYDEDTRRRMGLAGRRRVQSAFSWERSLQQVTELYESVAAPRR